MDFSYNENQKMIADMIQQFGKQNITPFVGNRKIKSKKSRFKLKRLFII